MTWGQIQKRESTFSKRKVCEPLSKKHVMGKDACSNMETCEINTG